MLGATGCKNPTRVGAARERRSQRWADRYSVAQVPVAWFAVPPVSEAPERSTSLEAKVHRRHALEGRNPMGATRRPARFGYPGREASVSGLKAQKPRLRSPSEERSFDQICSETACGPIASVTKGDRTSKSMLRRGKAHECCGRLRALTRPVRAKTARRVAKP
jgi:hypothetical protein